MTIKTAIDKGVDFLKSKGIESARLDTELILSHVLNVPRIQLYVEFDRPLTEKETVGSRKALVERGQGQPIAYIIGEKGFYKHDFFVTPGVLVPRPESELVVEKALELMGESGTVFDWGAGTGCLGLSLLAEKTQWRLFAWDQSDLACELTLENARRLGIQERTQVQLGRVEDIKPDVKADVIVANPPYIDEKDPELEENVRQHEPEAALISGEQGLQHHRQWAEKAVECLSSDGFYICEFGHRQAEDLKSILSGHFESVEIFNDLAGHDRVAVSSQGKRRDG